MERLERGGGALTLLEQYNGLGYANKGLPSPYIWSGTNQYVKGKYVADGVFDPNAVDKQLGCAALLKKMQPSAPVVQIPETPATVPTEIPTPSPAPTGWLSILVDTILKILSRRS